MSWTTSELKKKGLISLNKNFGQAYLVILVCSLIADVPSVFTVQNGLFLVRTVKNEIGLSLLLILTVVFIVIPITIGKSRFYLELRDGRGKFPTMWMLFVQGKTTYFNVIKGMITKYIIVFLGCLIFVIPGIIQYYRVFFVPWLLAENPDVNLREVMKQSEQMAKGEKVNIFIMQLSFVGWFLLSFFIADRMNVLIPSALQSVACVMIYALPLAYYYATVAELYVVLKEKLKNKC